MPLKIAAASLGVLLLVGAVRVPEVTFTKIYDLQPDEGVFAYARISPDGRTLAYASEMREQNGRVVTTQTVVDLAAKKVTFREAGIDAYWSTDGRRMIFLSQQGRSNVTIRHQDTGAMTRDVAPVSLGDYFSWATRDGRDLIMTIRSNYYYLDGDMGVLPSSAVVSCDGIGVGDRPLVSKDGRRVTTFVRGEVVVRNVGDCNDVVRTGLQGAKADFSWDGRYVAFHVPKTDRRSYEIVVVDLERRTMRTVIGLDGSSLFPSWTKDGRLCFRYDGADYRGFMTAENVLSLTERPLPSPGTRAAESPAWSALFPDAPAPASRTALVMIWAPWSAHAPDALQQLQQVRREFETRHEDVAVMTAIEPSSLRSDADRLVRQGGITLPEIRLAPGHFAMTEAVNQIPTTLLFRDGRQVDRRLGAQTTHELRAWVESAARQ